MDDYDYFDPPIWFAIFLLYVLPIAINLNGCIKNKRKIAPSLMVSIIYPTRVWIGIILWLFGMVFATEFFNKIELTSGLIAIVLGFIISNLVLFYPLFYNFKETFFLQSSFKNSYCLLYIIIFNVYFNKSSINKLGQ